MPTPWLNEYIRCVGSGGTLLIGSLAIWCGDWTDLLLVGPSVGDNLPVADADGTVERGRDRGELTIELRDILVDGRIDQDNAPVARASQRATVLSLMRTVANFFDDFCTDRRFTLQLHEADGGLWEGPAQFEDIGRWDIVNDVVSKTRLLITLNNGRLVETS